jgi:hypothetical protein
VTTPLPTNVDATDWALVAGGGANDHQVWHDRLHGTYNTPLLPGEVRPAWSTLSGWGLPGVVFSGGNTFTLAADRVFYAPFVVRKPVLVTALALSCTGAAASTHAKIGLYSCGADLQPSARLYSSPALDTATTGIKSVAGLSVGLPIGLYLVAVVCNSATPAFRAFHESASFARMDSGSNAFLSSLPADIGTTWQGTGVLPDPGTAWPGPGANASLGFLSLALMQWSLA